MTAAKAPAPLLGRAAIIAAEDLAYEVVEVPEWGGSVRLRGFTGTERDEWDGYVVNAERRSVTPQQIRVKRVALCLVDGDGKRLFTDRDMAELGKKSGAVLDRLDDIVLRLSGMRTGAAATATTPATPSDEDAAVAELGKDQSAASGSA